MVIVRGRAMDTRYDDGKPRQIPVRKEIR